MNYASVSDTTKRYRLASVRLRQFVNRNGAGERRLADLALLNLRQPFGGPGHIVNQPREVPFAHPAAHAR
jgi:hypothetical protein